MNSSQHSGISSVLPEQPAPTRFGRIARGTRLPFIAFGACFELSANHAELLQQALPHLPLACKESLSSSTGPHYSLLCRHKTSSAETVAYRLYRNGRLLFECVEQQEFLERFGSVVTLYVAEASCRRTFIHAGVVGWGNCAILIPGRSFAGKTTLVAQLVRAGATYYSDEFALVDQKGMVHPYARPLQVREEGSYLQTQRPVEDFGGVAGRKPLPVGLVIVSRYKPGAHWRPRPLSLGMGLLKVLDNTVSARRSPAVALNTLKQMVSNAVIVSGVRGEAGQIVDWIATHFTSPRKHSGATP